MVTLWSNLRLSPVCILSLPSWSHRSGKAWRAFAVIFSLFLGSSCGLSLRHPFCPEIQHKKLIPKPPIHTKNERHRLHVPFVVEGDGRNIAVDRRTLLLLLSGSVFAPMPFLCCHIEPALAANLPENSAEDEQVNCRNGTIVSEISVPGAYQQVCMKLPQRNIFLQSMQESITVCQGGNSGGIEAEAGRTGVAVWNSGLLITRILDRLVQNSEFSLLKGKTVLELGCGTALASIAAAKLGAKSVIATDANAEVLQLARKNINLNNASNIVKVRELQWGLLDAAEFENVADIVIGSDLTYNSGSWRSLAETMNIILKPDGLILYVSLGHSSFNVEGEVAGFLSVVESEQLELLTPGSSKWSEWGRIPMALPMILQASISMEERRVISANGGARVVLLVHKKPALMNQL